MFFRLSYLNPDEVTLGRQYQAIVPLLWLAAGSIGQRPTPMSRQKWLLPKDSPFGVLINPDSFAAFASASASRRDLTHVWIVIDDEHAFARMQAQLPRRLHVGRQPRIQGMSRALLKLSGGSVHDYATISADSPSPSRASRARRAATSAGIS